MNAIKDEYVDELKVTKKEQMAAAKRYVAKQERLMNMNLDELFSEGDYRNIKRKIKEA